MSTVDGRLVQVLGDEGIGKEVSSYFRGRVEAPELRVAFPESVEDIQKILRVARDASLPVFTTYDTYFPRSVSSQEGILLDFKKMNKIERIDPKNLVVHVQRGVTFEQLGEELKRYDIKLAPPVAATSKSVMEQNVARGLVLNAAKYPQLVVSNMLVVLADGRIQKTGTHALSEEAADLRWDGGPELSDWYYASEDIFGIVARASIYLFPVWEERRVLSFGFDKPDEAWGLIREIPRRELCIEALTLDKKEMMNLMGLTEDELPPWVVVVGLEGKKKLVDYQEKQVQEIVARWGGTKLDGQFEKMAEVMGEPWYAIDQPHVGFFTTFDRISKFDATVQDMVKAAGLTESDRKEIGLCILGRGSLCPV